MRSIQELMGGDILTPDHLNQYAREIESLHDSTIKIQKDLNIKTDDFNKRINNFYGKLIEIFGIFVAIFSFIILAIQSSLTCSGDWKSRLACSSSIFIPVTIVLIILILLTHYLKR